MYNKDFVSFGGFVFRQYFVTVLYGFIYKEQTISNYKIRNKNKKNQKKKKERKKTRLFRIMLYTHGNVIKNNSTINCWFYNIMSKWIHIKHNNIDVCTSTSIYSVSYIYIYIIQNLIALVSPSSTVHASICTHK